MTSLLESQCIEKEFGYLIGTIGLGTRSAKLIQSGFSTQCLIVEALLSRDFITPSYVVLLRYADIHEREKPTQHILVGCLVLKIGYGKI